MDKDLYNLPEYFTPAQKKLIEKPIDKKYIEEYNGFSYINHMVVVDILNRLFGLLWNWEIVDYGNEEVRTYTKKKKNNGRYGFEEEPMPAKNTLTPDNAPKNSYIWVLGKLTCTVILPNGETKDIVKMAYGSRPITSEDSKTQGQIYKGASSDALKKAASLLGIASNVYTKPSLYQKIQDDRKAFDVWDEEASNNLRKYVQQMSKLAQEIGGAKFQEYIDKFCQESMRYTTFGKITPSNIIYFIEYMKQQGLLKNSAA